MSIKGALHVHIKALALHDERCFEVEKEINSLSKDIEKNKTLIDNINDELKNLEGVCHKGSIHVKNVEIEAESLRKQEQQTKKMLDNVENAHEYKAVKKELDVILRKLDKVEEIIIEAWNNLDINSKNYSNKQKTAEIGVKECNENMQNAQKEIEKLKKELNEKKTNRENLVKNVPEEWLKVYERMKNIVPNPIVKALSSSCSVCFYNIFSQDLSKLKKSGIILCRNCYRFLYADE
jgi:predicted  nucleic acid-binding Zn-ribbon protein